MTSKASTKEILRKLKMTNARLVALDLLSTIELGTIDGVTAGTIAAGKAIVVDSNKDAASARNFSATNLKAGLSGTAGSVTVFPTTASKGDFKITCTDQTGNTEVTFIVAAMGQATAISLPDPGAASDTVVLTAATQTLTNKTIAGPAPIAVGASATAAFGKTYLLNTAAGSVLTLPAATGSGGMIRVYVTTTATSGAHKVLAASVSDFFNGIVTGENANTAKCFASAAATNHSLQMPFAGTQPSGGFIGDWFELKDIAANLWTVSGMYQAGTTPTTPFSSATS